MSGKGENRKSLQIVNRVGTNFQYSNYMKNAFFLITTILMFAVFAGISIAAKPVTKSLSSENGDCGCYYAGQNYTRYATVCMNGTLKKCKASDYNPSTKSWETCTWEYDGVCGSKQTSGENSGTNDAKYYNYEPYNGPSIYTNGKK